MQCNALQCNAMQYNTVILRQNPRGPKLNGTPKQYLSTEDTPKQKGVFSSDDEKLVNYQKRGVFRIGLNLVKVSASLMMDTIHGDFLENKILRFDKNLAVVL